MWGHSDQIASHFLKKTSHQWPGVRLLQRGELGHGNVLCSWHIVSSHQTVGKPTVLTHLRDKQTLSPPPPSPFFTTTSLYKNDSKITQAENGNKVLLYPSWTPPGMISNPNWKRNRQKEAEVEEVGKEEKKQQTWNQFQHNFQPFRNACSWKTIRTTD